MAKKGRLNRDTKLVRSGGLVHSNVTKYVVYMQNGATVEKHIVLKSDLNSYKRNTNYIKHEVANSSN